MSWAESWRLLHILLQDPTSHVGAAVAGYAYPFSREAAILADLYDLTTRVNSDPKKGKKPEPYPRPWKDETGKKHSGKTDLSPEEARHVLATQFGKPEPAKGE